MAARKDKPQALHGLLTIHGVDQKVLARSYVFGDHSSLFKSLRERSAMEFAKETLLSRKIPRWVLGGILCTCIFADPAPL